MRLSDPPATDLRVTLNTRIEALAAELLLRARHEPRQPMGLLARRLGVHVVREDLGGGLAGCALRRLATVVVAPSGYSARDEFTLAHELVEMFLPP